LQNFAVGAATLWQAGQSTDAGGVNAIGEGAGCREAPQAPQNLFPCGESKPHAGQQAGIIHLLGNRLTWVCEPAESCAGYLTPINLHPATVDSLWS
jgi:hypothetical protein